MVPRGYLFCNKSVPCMNKTYQSHLMRLLQQPCLELTKRRGKCFKVKHKRSSKLEVTALGQAGQAQCDNGLKNIPV